MKSIIKLPCNTVIKRDRDKILYLNPSAPDWIVINNNASLALQLCNGERTVEEIGEILSLKGKKDVREDIRNFFSDLLEGSFFFCPREYEFHPYRLSNVHLNLTDRCNLKCIYCYAEERRDKEKKLIYEDYVDIVNQVNNLTGPVRFEFTGGEPLLFEEIFNLAEYCKKSGNKITLLTNGTLINKNNVSQIADLFDLVKISIDGSKEEIHDFHRGAGSFEKTIKSIELLMKKTKSLLLSMTVTKRNIDNMANMTEQFGNLLSFAPLFKAGRGRESDLAITGEEYYLALSSIKGVNPLQNLRSILLNAKKRKNMKCMMGDGEISISDTGNIYPCHLLHVPEFLCGNIKEKSLEDIYNNSPVLKKCRNLTVDKIEGCSACDVRFICGGACRARAYYEKNRIDINDDFCEYEKIAFIKGMFDLYEFE